jgi:hypothetical protein
MNISKISGLCFAAAITSLTTVTAWAVEPPNPKDLIQGKWELLLDKSKYCGTPPKAADRHIFDAGWGLIVTEWGGTEADGKPTVNRYVARYDGGKYPGNITRPDTPKSESISWNLVDPRHLEFVHYDKQDKVTSTYTREVSADGQMMTQVSTFVGRECKDVQVFQRK